MEVIHLKGFIGGPDRDRTDDLFHAMERRDRCFVDGKGLTNGPIAAKCYQFATKILTEQGRAVPWGSGCDQLLSKRDGPSLAGSTPRRHL